MANGKKQPKQSKKQNYQVYTVEVCPACKHARAYYELLAENY